MKLSRIFLVCGFAAAVAIGCDSGGIDRSKKLSDLSQADAKAECEHLASLYPTKTVDCSGQSVPIGVDGSDCAGSDFEPPPAGCPITVGQDEDCLAAEYNAGSALCTGTIPDACQPVIAAGSACGN